MIAQHLYGVLNTSIRKMVIATLAEQIKLSGLEFDSIVVQGASGLLVGPGLSEILDKNLILSRKSPRQEPAHSRLELEGEIGQKYIIVDDFISTGNTIHEIVGKMSRSPYFQDMKLIGLFCYNTPHSGASWCDLNNIYSIPCFAPAGFLDGVHYTYAWTVTRPDPVSVDNPETQEEGEVSHD